MTGLTFEVFRSALDAFIAVCVSLFSLFPIHLLTFSVTGIHEGSAELSSNYEAGAVFLGSGKHTRR